MKYTKLLLSISFMLMLHQQVSAQKIINNAKFLYLSYNTMTGRNKVSFTQISRIGSTGNAYTFDVDTLVELNNKVYYLNGLDSVAFYDYSLQVGDTFLFNPLNGGNDTMKVDSIKMVQLNDGNYYKHWYLNTQRLQKLIWIEGLGCKKLGWNRYNLISIGGVQLKSICANDTLVYWDNSYNGFEPHTVAATCDYNTLLNYNGLNSLKQYRINIYPNPVQGNNITVSSKTATNYQLLDYTGKELASGKLQIGENTVPLTNVKNGLYLLRVDGMSYKVAVQR